ncbi:MAG: inositol monophosphatase [Rhodospirillaceae bacterium]|nr:inositol monophosphatase [Rhodospirillaceae bacterium]
MAAVRSAVINVMVKAAQRAARSLVRDFGEVEQLQVSRKGPADFVSNADKSAERILREELHKARPSYSMLLEETGRHEGDDPDSVWLVDPLDGTTNFLHGLPVWSISIALEQKGELTAGVVFNPITDELFWAEKGQGAYLNDRRLRVSGRRQLPDALIATGMPFMGRGETDAFLEQLRAVLPKVAGVRRWGSAALDLAYVAAGRYEAFWETGLHAWDMAAGIVLVREAGGYVTEIGGGHNPAHNGSILAANPHLHLPLGKILRDAGAS